MVDKPNPQELKQYAADLLRQGKTTPEIEQALVEKGSNRTEARQILDDLYSGNIKKQDRQENLAGMAMMILGIVISITAAAVSYNSYHEVTSSPYGGTYTIWYGPIIAGIALFVAGAAKQRRDK